MIAGILGELALAVPLVVEQIQEVFREDGLDQQRCYIGDGDRVPQYRITDGSETWAVVCLLAKGVFITLSTGAVAVISGLFLLDLLGFFVFA